MTLLSFTVCRTHAGAWAGWGNWRAPLWGASVAAPLMLVALAIATAEGVSRHSPSGGGRLGATMLGAALAGMALSLSGRLAARAQAEMSWLWAAIAVFISMMVVGLAA